MMNRSTAAVRHVLTTHAGVPASNRAATTARLDTRSKTCVAKRINISGLSMPFSSTSAHRRTRTTVGYETLADHIVGPDGLPLAPLASIPVVAKKGSKARIKATPSSTEQRDSAIQDPRIQHPAPAEGHEWPKLAMAVLTDMSRFPDTILLTKVGGFYESYFHQAPVLASILGIKLATRKWGGTTVPMAGFPVFQLEKYLKTLVLDKGLLVAIAEEFRAPSGATKPVKLGSSAATTDTGVSLHNETVDISRRVTRVVSPGTLIDEKFLDPFVNNFIVGVSALPPQGDTGTLKFGLAWLDVGTADFNTTVCDDYQSLRDGIARVAPREVVIDGSVIAASDLSDDLDSMPETLGEDGKIRLSIRDLVMDSSVYVSRFDPTLSPPVTSDISARLMPKEEIGDEAEAKAVRTLLAYLRTRLLDDSESLEALTITTPLHMRQEATLRIDAHTLDALEIKERGREGSVRGSLFSVLRRTVTRGGTRLLQQWLTAPSTSLSTIQGRLDIVHLFLRLRALREDVRGLMRQGAGDAGRVLQKLVTKRNDEQDLLEIRDFISTTSRITSTLMNEVKHNADRNAQSNATLTAKHADQWEALQTLANKFHNLDTLGTQLGDAIDERVIESRTAKQESMAMEMETQAISSNIVGGAAERRASAAYYTSSSTKSKASEKDGQEDESSLWGEPFEHLIRPASSKVLSNAVKAYTKLRRDASKLQSEFRQGYGDHVSLRFVMGQGFVVHSRGKAITSMTSSSATLSTDMTLHIAGKNRSTHTYYSKPWSLLGHKIEKTAEEIKKLEALELESLRQQVLIQVAALRRNARLMDQLDVMVGFSQVAEEYELVRPQIDETQDLVIKEGRHLSVEIGLLERGRPFTRNDICMHSEDVQKTEATAGRVQLITGPNMGGKSTYLRQVAMICILAQCGCFVPATAARIGLVDAIFTRIGAQDDLFRDRSTFMVEMTEVGEILSRSTSKSLVIADEIGRGTSNLTGIAIGFSTLVELYNKQCRTLFATHFHEILDLVESSQAQGSLQQIDFFATDVFSPSPAPGATSTDSNSKLQSIIYSHKLRPGHNRDSYGLQVAQLANLPTTALSTAGKTLEYLQVKHPKSVDYRDSHNIIFPPLTSTQR